MTSRLSALPRSAYRANPEVLRRRQASLAAAHKNTASVHRQFVLATCAKLRREMKQEQKSS